jgi:hypothetical protein
MFSIPDEKGRITQPNDGDAQGNILMSYNLDLGANKGRVEVSAQVKKLVNNADNADFAGYAGSIGAYSDNGATGKIFAVSDKVFSADITDIFGTWDEETTGDEPNSGNTVMDSAFFDGLFLVSEAADIKSWNGSTWASWWQGTAGQSALDIGERHLIWTGADGNLYIVDFGNKVYRVTPTGTVTKTGAGTLDFSATNYEITCAVTNSNRSFIGTWDKTGEEAVIIEWDMSPSASTANKLHPIGAKAVRCIAIWNDTPIAILSNGRVKYFNGSSFVDFDKSMQFPITDDAELSEEFIHPNGWAIIDDLPHFLVTGRVEGTSGLVATKSATYQMPSGVWCLDLSIGLYHRFALGTGLNTQEDYGKMNLANVGALYSLQKTASKFLASYEYYLDDESGTRSVLSYHDASNTQNGRGFLITPFAFGLRKMWKNVELWHKTLATGEKIRVFYRSKKQEALSQSGVWASTTQFNITGTNLGIVSGDVAFIKMGNGSGQLLRVSAVNESSAITAVTFTEANTFVAENDLGVIDFLNFKFMGEITDTTQDYHDFAIPTTEKRRKLQFLFEFQQVAGNEMELDYAIINPE